MRGSAAVELYPGDVVALGRVAALVAARRVRLPIADVFPLDSIGDAYRALDRREAPGKIVLGLRVVDYPGQKVKEPAIKEQDVTLGVPTPHAHSTWRRPYRPRSATAACAAGTARSGERKAAEERSSGVVIGRCNAEPAASARP